MLAAPRFSLLVALTLPPSPCPPHPPRFPCPPTRALKAIIYVVDSTDTERIGISRDEFKALLDEEELRDSLILVFANKQVGRGRGSSGASGRRSGAVTGRGRGRGQGEARAGSGRA